MGLGGEAEELENELMFLAVGVNVLRFLKSIFYNNLNCRQGKVAKLEICSARLQPFMRTTNKSNCFQPVEY